MSPTQSKFRTLRQTTLLAVALILPAAASASDAERYLLRRIADLESQLSSCQRGASAPTNQFTSVVCDCFRSGMGLGPYRDNVGTYSGSGPGRGAAEGAAASACRADNQNRYSGGAYTVENCR